MCSSPSSSPFYNNLTSTSTIISAHNHHYHRCRLDHRQVRLWKKLNASFPLPPPGNIVSFLTRPLLPPQQRPYHTPRPVQILRGSTQSAFQTLTTPPTQPKTYDPQQSYQQSKQPLHLTTKAFLGTKTPIINNNHQAHPHA